MDGKYGHRNREREIDADRDQRDDDEDDGPREARGPVLGGAASMVGSLIASCPCRPWPCVVGFFVVVVVVFVLFALGLLDRDLGFVFQAEAAGGDHLLAFLQAADDLHAIALAHAHRDLALVRHRIAGRSPSPSGRPHRN